MNIKIENYRGKIRLRFTYEGTRRCLSLGLPFTEENLTKAELVKNHILSDIEHGGFDSSLSRYFFNPNRRKKDKSKVEVLTVWKKWIPTLDLSVRTYNNHYLAIEKCLVRDRPKIYNCAEWWSDYAKNYAWSTYNQRLLHLKSCLQWGCDYGLITENPLRAFKNRRRQHVRVIPFTPDEANLIIQAFRRDTFCSPKSSYKHSFYADFIEFLFRTGFRPSEAIGLRVKDIDFIHSVISIDTVLARGDKGQSTSRQRVRKTTKTGYIRSVKMTPRLLVLLEGRIHKYSLEPDSLVFFSFSGQAINDRTISQRYWKKVLQGLGLEHRKLYATRHTLASIALTQTTPAIVAKMLGHKDARMVYEHYGNIIDIPGLPEF